MRELALESGVFLMKISVFTLVPLVPSTKHALLHLDLASGRYDCWRFGIWLNPFHGRMDCEGPLFCFLRTLPGERFSLGSSGEQDTFVIEVCTALDL
jgi:hypothetical protein